MQDDRRDDTARFMQAIAAFSADIDPVGELGRRIGSTEQDALGGILTEIAETVLRRYLTFANSDGQEVQIDVAERRVHRVLAIPRAWSDDFGVLVGVDLSEGHGTDLLQLLQRVAGSRGALFVRTDLPDREKAAGFKGVTLRELRETQHRSVALDLLPDNLAAALMRAQSSSAASLVLQDGSTVQHSGDQALQEVLERVCQTFTETICKTPVLHLWHEAVARDCAVIAYHGAEVTFALLVRSERMMSVFVDLNAVIKQPEAA